MVLPLVISLCKNAVIGACCAALIIGVFLALKVVLRVFGGWANSVRRGHVNVLTGVVLLLILAVLGVGFSALEIVHVALWPLRVMRTLVDRFFLGKSKKKARVRRIVVFDGICVLCNAFGSFVVPRLNDKESINFVPFQDPSANPHVNMALLEKEFPSLTADALKDRLCAVHGENIYWGADAIMKTLSWCHYPFPVAAIGWLFPPALRDAIYRVVATNRYDVFGTQPLEKNFAKSLCPYLFVKSALGIGKKKES